MKKIILILFVVLCGAVGAVAQDAVVRSFEVAPMDVSAQQFARTDRNGQKCALVKVVVVASGVSFQGNVMGDVRKNGSEYWVYLTAGTKMVRILADTFLAFMYNFPEPLQGGVTYVLTIDAPQPAPPVPQKKKQNFLALKVSPPTAHVTVDGAALPLKNGAASKLLPAGTHSLSVTAPGYASVEETVTIGSEKVTRNIALRSVMPTLTVTAATPGTEIYINDERKGTDRWSGELFADTYEVEGRLASHRTNSRTITLSESESRTLAIPALEPITGSLSIDYTPMDAAVTVDGRAAGTTPLLLDDLLIGAHKVEIAAPGYTTATLTANVTESTPATLTGALTAAPTDPYAADIPITNEYSLFQDSSTGKYGYIHNGSIVIPAKYDDVWYFSEGLAKVKINGKWGFIDKSGTLVIPARYDGAGDFSEGLAWVKINGKNGFIDKSGTLVIPARYDGACYFSEGLAGVKVNGKLGFIDKSGTLVIPARYDDAWDFSEGLAMVNINGKWGFIDKSGTLVIPTRYDDALNFHEGLAGVKINGKYGFIDKSGTLVIPARYDGVYGFKNGKAKVELNGREFYIDKDGNELD